MCNKNVTTLLKKWASMACFTITLCSYVRCSHAAPEHSSHDRSSTSTKPVRKGTLGFIGTQSEVHTFHRQYIVYDSYEMYGHPEQTRYETPQDGSYNPEDYSHEPFPIGVKYQVSSQDKRATVLQSREFKYIVQYEVEAQIAGQDIRDAVAKNPKAAASVEWNGMDPNASTVSKALAASDYTFSIGLGSFASINIPAGIFQSAKMLDTGLITKGEVFENQNPFNEQSPTSKSFEKQMSCAATIVVDGGNYSHADALAQLEVFVAPPEGVGGIKQFSVKEAFNYPGAIR